MILDTNSLFSEAKAIFKGEVEIESIDNMLLKRYCVLDHHPEATKIEYKLTRLFAIHNYKDGYMWLRYTQTAYDKSGGLIYGAYNIPIKWQIHKEDGEWRVIFVWESP